jgi:GPH family glycoside/pentoside/hexuronide:cation symporter
LPPDDRLNAEANRRAREKRGTHLGAGMKSLYGTGAFVDAVTGAALNTFLFFYLTAICGLSGSLAGLSSAIALIFDAFADPFIGSFSDSTWTRWGRRHPYMILSALPVAISLGLLFSIPVDLKGVGLFAYATAILLILRVSISFYNLPFTALGAEFSDDYTERSTIVAWRFLFGVVAGLIVYVLGYGVFLSGKLGLLDRAGYAPLGWTSGLIALVFALICAFGTLRTVDRLHQVATNLKGLLRRFIGEVADIFRNQSFRVLFFSALIFFIAAGTSTALGLHMNNFFWRMPNKVILATGLAYPAGLVVGIPVTALMSRALEKRSVVITGLLIVSLSLFLFPILRIIGVLPPNGDTLYTILIVNSAVIGLGVTFVSIAYQSMMADAADEHEDLFGGRREGLYFAGLGFSAKAASGAGNLIAGFLIDFIHFPVDLASKANASAHIAPDVVRNLGIWAGSAPAALLSVSAALIVFWRIDKTAHSRIQQSLSDKRLVHVEPPAL